MKKVPYSDKLKDPRWQKKRLKIMERDNFACKYCMDDKTTLHIHHLKYTGDPWDAPDSDLVTSCEDCHFIVGFLKGCTVFEIDKRGTPTVFSYMAYSWDSEFQYTVNIFTKNITGPIKFDSCISLQGLIRVSKKLTGYKNKFKNKFPA